MLCNSLATWFATLYKRAVFLSPYHIIEYYSKAFLQKPLKFQLDHISLSVYNQCLKKPRSPKEAAQYEEQIVHTKVSKSHVLSHYLSSSPPNTLCSYTTYRNQEKIFMHMCLIDKELRSSSSHSTLAAPGCLASIADRQQS